MNGREWEMSKISEPAAQLSKEEIDHRLSSIRVTQASMELEGFFWDKEQKDDFQKFAHGDITTAQLTQKYLAEASKAKAKLKKDLLTAATANKS